MVLSTGPSFDNWSAYNRISEFLRSQGITEFRVSGMKTRLVAESEKPRNGRFVKKEAEARLRASGLDPNEYVIKIYFSPGDFKKVSQMDLSNFKNTPLILKAWEVKDDEQKSATA